MNNRNSICVLFLIFSTIANAQKYYPPPQYKLDEFDVYIKDPLIFDHPFKLLLELSTETSFYNHGFFYKSDYATKDISSPNEKYFHGQFTTNKVAKKPDGKYLWHFDVPDLYPNTEYIFIIPIVLDNSTISKLHDLNLQIYLKSLDPSYILTKDIQLRDKYDNLIRYTFVPTIDLPEQKILEANGFKLFSFDEYITYFNSYLKSNYSKIQQQFSPTHIPQDYKDFIDHIDTLKIDAIISDLNPIVEYLADEMNASIPAYNDVLQIIFKLQHAKQYKFLSSILFGIQPLDYSTKLSNYESVPFEVRMKNILDLKDKLSKVLLILQNPAVPFPTDLDRENIFKLLSSINDLYKGSNNEFDSVKKDIESRFYNLFQIKYFKGSTLPLKYTERISNLVKADIGIQTFNGIEGKLIGSSTALRNLRPYIGLMVYPWNSNDDLPTSQQRFINNFFIQAGLTIGSISEENVREDLFNKNNILIGIGARYQSFHIGVGSILYKLTYGNTLISSPSLGSGLYVSLGIHPNLNNIISPLTNLFLK